MTQAQIVAQVFVEQARALTIVQLMARTGWEAGRVRNVVAQLQRDGIITHGPGIVTGRMGRRRVRYALTVIPARRSVGEAA